MPSFPAPGAERAPSPLPLRMTTNPSVPLASLAEALGRVPSGLFIVTTRLADATLGFVGSFVQQVGFDPPTVMVAIAAGRDHLAGVRESGRFAVSVLGEGDRGLMKPFFKASTSGTPFDQVATHTTSRGATVLADALAWLDCRVTGEQDVGDHTVVFGVVEEGARTRDAAPLVHVRKNGLGY